MAKKKNITFSAEEELIEQARQIARERNTTLHSAFLEWLGEYTRSQLRVERYKNLMDRLSYVKAGRKFTRDEMNERK